MVGASLEVESIPSKQIHGGGSAIAITLRSVSKINSNYICGSPSISDLSSFNGISCMDSDMSAKRNLILHCSKQQTKVPMNGVRGDTSSDDNDDANNGNISTLGLCTGILVKHRAKLELVDNFIQRCDVGIYIGKHMCLV